MAHRIGLDLGQMRLAIAQGAQRLGHGAVDDLEIAAARELLEFHQREIRLDAGRVAIHHEADRAGGGDDGDLRIAIAVLFAQRQGKIPGRLGVGGEHPAVGRQFVERGEVEANGCHRQVFIAMRLAIGGATMVADDAQHMVPVRAMAGEGTMFLRHFGGGRVADACHDRRQGAADRAAFIRVIAEAR